MPYKDKEKKKEAQKRYRDSKRITKQGITGQGITPESVVPDVIPYEVVKGMTVYGRQAVRYDLQEVWELRPEPESPGDTPKPLNRGKYIRSDGSEYQIDATGVIRNPSTMSDELPANFGQPDCECMHCQQSRRSDLKLVINHGKHKFFDELAINEVNRVTLPGDVDYTGVAQPAQ